ncbi:hypothetical protein B0H10DRAFT_2200300 [Mycena sp. CBHHK59/15]|nr:hypothetical protein B0H10DRAFT_2200300 [Mycena sp. CBHHK59/15]
MRRGEQRMREGDVCARRTRTRDAVDVQAASFSSRVSEAQSERRRVREMGYTKEEQRAKRGSARAQGQSRCRPSDGARRYNKGKPNKMESVGRETGELSPFELTIKPVDGSGQGGVMGASADAREPSQTDSELEVGVRKKGSNAEGPSMGKRPNTITSLKPCPPTPLDACQANTAPAKAEALRRSSEHSYKPPGDGKPATELRIGWITYEHDPRVAWVLPANWAQLNLPVAPFAAALQCDPTDDIPISIYLIPQPGARLYFFKAHIALKKRNFFASGRNGFFKTIQPGFLGGIKSNLGFWGTTWVLVD